MTIRIRTLTYVSYGCFIGIINVIPMIVMDLMNPLDNWAIILGYVVMLWALIIIVKDRNLAISQQNNKQVYQILFKRECMMETLCVIASFIPIISKFAILIMIYHICWVSQYEKQLIKP